VKKPIGSVLWFLALSLGALALVMLGGAPAARAQSDKFPTSPITLIVPFAPGGATDIVARLLATHVSEDMGQPVVVDNRAGGAGNIGTAAAARAKPDGYTLVLATTTQLINQYLMKDLQYDLFTDLVPVALIADAPELVGISAKLPAKTLSEFVAAARAEPSGFNYGSAGIGSVPHLGGEVLARAMKTKLVHVPFRGSADAAKDVAAGNVQMTLATQASLASFVEAGLIRLVAVAAPKRLSTLTNVPTTVEAGLPGVELSNWFGIMAPRNTPPRLVAQLNQSFNKALALASVQSTLTRQGIEPVRETPEQFATRLRYDGQSYKKLVDEIGLTPK
jgi:tripartite-type tricarboxylate transporter receptor subunit TctC